MYKDLKAHFWWNSIKKNSGKCVAQGLTYQKVKTEHQVPIDKLQSLPIPAWKWDHTTMDFVGELPTAEGGANDLVTWAASPVILDEVVRLHRVPASIVSDGDLRFVLHSGRGYGRTLGPNFC